MVRVITQDIKIPTDGRPIEAFAKFKEEKPEKAFLLLPGQGYTINHFLLDFMWRMAAENGFYAIKAEYRGFTYRHLDEPYDHRQAAIDVGYMLDYLTAKGYTAENIIVCAKSLGTIALGNITLERDLRFDRAILLTPVLYIKKSDGVFPTWADYNQKVRKSCLVFGTDDPYCDPENARLSFPDAAIECYEGADHGLVVEGDYARTIKINREIIEKVKKFVIE